MYSVAFFIASLLSNPFKNPEFTAIPFSTSVNGSSISIFNLSWLSEKLYWNFASISFCNLSASSLILGIITGFIGKLNFLANSKSLASCAGTAIIAPVPYVINT